MTSTDALTKSLVDIAIESWRFIRRSKRILTKLDVDEEGRYMSQLDWFYQQIENSLSNVGMRIENIEGREYDSGVAATPLNAGDFSPDDILVVDQVLEPIVMGDNGVVRSGTIMLRKIEK